MAKGRIPLEMRPLLESVRKRAIKAHGALDAEIALLPKACGKGCSACCHQMVYIHTWEEEPIRHYISTVMFEKTRKEVRKQLLAWWRTFASMARRATPAAPLTEEEQKQIQLEMRTRRVACPYLVADACSIYPVRPAICRSHVVDSNPARCADDPHRQGDPRAIEPFMRIFGAESEHLPRADFPHGQKPLAYCATDIFRVPVPSTPMLGYLLDGTHELVE